MKNHLLSRRGVACLLGALAAAAFCLPLAANGAERIVLGEEFSSIG